MSNPSLVRWGINEPLGWVLGLLIISLAIVALALIIDHATLAQIPHCTIKTVITGSTTVITKICTNS
jgi:hypothetical protein